MAREISVNSETRWSGFIIMSGSDVIDVPDLPEPGALFWKSRVRAGQSGPSGCSRGASCRGRRRHPRQVQRICGTRCTWSEKLRENGWNISKTAEVIGTPRSNLYKKLEQDAIKQETDG